MNAALQSHSIFPGNECSSSLSSIDCCEQTSSFASFHTTHSNHSSTIPRSDAGYTTPPKSIFLDDVNNQLNLPDHDDIAHGMHLDETDDDGSSFVVDVENVDHFLIYVDIPPVEDMLSEEEDAASIPSTTPSVDKGYPAQYQHHRFDRMTLEETASYKIMSLLDNAGAPRICYDRLVALLKKLSKQEGFDVRKALNRDTLMRRMERRYKSRPTIQKRVLNNQEVFRFSFQESLQDLLYGSSKHLHEISPYRLHDNNVVRGTEYELWNTQWMLNTFATEEYEDFDPKKDIMLPVILYMDKTGTDVNQRYGALSQYSIVLPLSHVNKEKVDTHGVI
jgi:hypothetical protein